jgi:hypothetical protein
MMNKNLISISLLVALLMTSVSALAAQPKQGDSNTLFAQGDSSQLARSAVRPTVTRGRVVQVETALLETSTTLQLNLFPDLVLNAERERLEAASAQALTWVGHLEDLPESDVTLSVVDGVVAGSINLPESTYLLRPTADGQTILEEIDLRALPAGSEPLVPELGREVAATGEIGATSTDDGQTIDIMVVYTEEMRQAVGGTAGAEALINSIIAQTNVGYEQSQIAHRLRLVRAAQVDYEESGSAITDLQRLQNGSDGYLDEVHQWRDEVKADLVTMLVDSMSNSCGIAYLMSSLSPNFAPYAFSVVQWECGSTNYSLAHEAGHSMGAQHDIDNAHTSGTFPYAYGYQAPDRSFRTVMSYNCSSYCPRVNYWSNPDVTYGGQPTGVAEEADNHRALNNAAYTVANFRVGSIDDPAVEINYTLGSQGSAFTVQAVDFPTDQSSEIWVNGMKLESDSRTTEGGELVFELYTEQADEGAYMVKLIVDGVSADTIFHLDENAPLRESTGVGLVLNVPAGIGLGNRLYLPALQG